MANRALNEYIAKYANGDLRDFKRRILYICREHVEDADRLIRRLITKPSVEGIESEIRMVREFGVDYETHPAYLWIISPLPQEEE